MAIQKNQIILEGQIGDLSFYHSNGKPLVRRHSGVPKKRIDKDPRFVRTRENNAEFGQASRAAKRIRLAVTQSLGERRELFEDATVVNRLTTRMSAIIKADSIHDRGDRTVLPGNLPLLGGFGFGAGPALKDVLFVPPRYTFQRDTGLLAVMLPALASQAVLAVPKSAVFCSFHVAAVSFHVDDGSLPFEARESELLPLGHSIIPAQTLDFNLPDAANDPVIICFGISFFGRLGGYPVPLRDAGRNAMEVIGVDIDAGMDEPFRPAIR